MSTTYAVRSIMFDVEQVATFTDHASAWRFVAQCDRKGIAAGFPQLIPAVTVTQDANGWWTVTDTAGIQFVGFPTEHTAQVFADTNKRIAR